MSDLALVWFRRDLRDFDHAALARALQAHRRVVCVFVFDRSILDPLPREDRRVEFILESLRELDGALRRRGGGLITRHGVPEVEIPALAKALGVAAVYANRDYEPAARRRDEAVARALAAEGIRFEAGKDQVIFDRDEVLTQAGTPFSVFTPYCNAWLRRLEQACPVAHPVAPGPGQLQAPPSACGLPTLEALGFRPTNLAALRLPTGMGGGRVLLEDFLTRMDHYQARRDFPAVKGVSYLSTHLRFGTVSIRELVTLARGHGGAGAQTWLKELVWREFYQMILWHHPRVVGHAFKPDFDQVVWDERPEWFAAWCAGQTGYPLVDAAMRQLNQTGYMHNRLRMVTASFLTKDLGIDWRLGEAYFAERLLDFDLAANNGGWQWAASTGCDAQPWFRIFNPVTQSEKFDPHGRFIRRYVPELASCPDRHVHAPWRLPPLEQQACGCVLGRDYPLPLVDHAAARERTLARFAVVKAPSQ